MALTLTKQPDLYSLSGNPVIFEISTDTTGHDYHKLHARITYDGDLKGEDALPVIDGKAEFDISDYLKEIFNGHFGLDGDINNVNIIKDYEIEYFETYDYDGNEYGNQTDVYKVCQGKIDFLNLINLENESPSQTFYSKFINPGNNILSFSKEGKYLKAIDLIYLYANYSDYKLKFGFSLKNSPTENIEKDIELNIDDINFIPYGFYNLVLPLISGETWKDDIFSIKITLAYDDGSSYVDMFSYVYFYKDFSNLDYKTIIFKNELGVYECFPFYGILETTNNYNRNYSEKNDSDSILSGSHKKSFTANTGWITKDEYDSLLLLFKSKDTYIFESYDLQIPIVIMSTKTNKKRTDKYLYSLEIEFEYAHTDYY